LANNAPTIVARNLSEISGKLQRSPLRRRLEKIVCQTRAGRSAQQFYAFSDGDRHLMVLVVADRTDSGYRKCTAVDVQTLRFIKRSRDLGFSIERIKTLLSVWDDRGRKSADVRKLIRQYIAELDHDIEKLQSIRTQLQHLAKNCHGDHRPCCPIIDELATASLSRH
jgi:MerR family copper efflux transcriptional regulator